jgi:hypothetical protein
LYFQSVRPSGKGFLSDFLLKKLVIKNENHLPDYFIKLSKKQCIMMRIQLPRTMIFTVLITVFYSLTANADEFSFYVSPKGNDSWSGDRIERPFATIQRARDAIRELKNIQELTKPATVYIRAGIYELDETLVFKPEDSGTINHPVKYVAYNNEKPVISGGKAIKSHWERYKGNIMVCDIPEAKNENWKFRQLFLNGKRMDRARIPNKGSYYRIEKTEEDPGRSAMKFREGDFEKWNNLDDVEVVIFHSWNESRLFVSDVDAEKQIVTFTGPIGVPLGKFTERVPNRYYIENVLEGLDYPGEWYLDSDAGKLYLYSTENLDNSELRAPLINQLVKLKGNPEEQAFVEFIEFSGLTFSDAGYDVPPEGIPTLPDVGDIYKPSAITLEGAKFCKFENNFIRNVGTYALEVTGDANKIIRNKIYNAGSGGIITRSYGKERNIISYNHIHDCGAIFYSGCGINIDDGGGKIANNLIHDISQTGVYGRHWATSYQEEQRRNQEQELLIEYNEIHDVGSKLNDCAGIFIRDSNIVIRNNLIYNVYSYKYYENLGHFNNCGVPGWGIYLGCETRNSLVENNIIYNMTEGMHIFYGTREVIIRNNIFADCEVRQIRYETPPNLDMSNNHFIQNIVYNTRPYSEVFSVSRENSLPVESDYNVLFHSGGKTPIIRNQGGGEINSLEDWLKEGFEENSMITDPLFKNPESHNYDLLPGSPAIKVGFNPIDISKVGLRGESQH